MTGYLLANGLSVALAIASLAAGLAPATAWADPSRAEPSRSFFSCDRRYDSLSDLAGSQESADLYHGLAYAGGAIGITLGGNPSHRWTGENGFDNDIRDELRLDSASAREDANLASDITLALALGVLPAASIASKFLRTHDCVETWDMFTDLVESFGLTLFASETVKLVAGRNRPFAQDCGPFAPRDSKCGRGDRGGSFFSGHASLAAAGAGITCSYAFRREAWGSSRMAKATPCAIGTLAALTTGVLRIASDQHWGTDVLVGFAVGAAVGYFDTWGPLDLLKFTTRDSHGRISSRGMVLPHSQNGRFGAQLVMTF